MGRRVGGGASARPRRGAGRRPGDGPRAGAAAGGALWQRAASRRLRASRPGGAWASAHAAPAVLQATGPSGSQGIRVVGGGGALSGGTGWAGGSGAGPPLRLRLVPRVQAPHPAPHPAPRTPPRTPPLYRTPHRNPPSTAAPLRPLTLTPIPAAPSLAHARDGPLRPRAGPAHTAGPHSRPAKPAHTAGPRSRPAKPVTRGAVALWPAGPSSASPRRR